MTGVEWLFIGLVIGMVAGTGIEAMDTAGRERAAFERGRKSVDVSPATTAVVLGCSIAVVALRKISAYRNGYRDGYRQAQLDFRRDQKVAKMRQRSRPKPKSLKS